MSTGSVIRWHDWSTEAFAAARRGAMPVLLLVTVRWSVACARLERDVLTALDVTAVLDGRFVPVRVDADRRPDLAERYGLGGWPTLACLTPDGEILTGGTAIDAPRLAALLDEVSRTFAAQRDEIDRRTRDLRRARRGQAAAGREAAGGDARAFVSREIRAAFDEAWAGFGKAGKQPLVAPIAWALVEGRRSGDAALLDIAVRTLDRIGWSALSDAGGAFNRACAQRDWTAPETARLLQVQADVATLMLDAALVLGEESYAERARAALDYVLGTLLAPEGAFFNSESEPDGAARHIDPAIVTSANARMVRALLHGAEVLHAPHFGDAALQAIERLVPLAYAPGAGVSHYLLDGSPRVRGLLADQVDVTAALLDLYRAAGNRVYLDLADELMRSCLRKLWSESQGALLDRLPTTSGAGDVGRLGEPLFPFAVNCHAARVLLELAGETGEEEFRTKARAVLAFLEKTYAAEGLMAAEYVLVV